MFHLNAFVFELLFVRPSVSVDSVGCKVEVLSCKHRVYIKQYDMLRWYIFGFVSPWFDQGFF